MQKKLILIIILTLLLLFSSKNVYAHPGRTNAQGCHTCKTNCSSWGLSNGEYHCHSGNTYKNSKDQTFNSKGQLLSDTQKENSTTSNNNNQNSSSTSTSNNSKAPTQTSKPKSSNTNLKTLLVDSKSLEINKEMEYATSNRTPKITATPEDKLATIKIDAPEQYSLENINTITITVTAEDKTVEKYTLNLDILSVDTSLKQLFINEEEVSPNKIIEYSTTSNELKIDAISSDSKATIKNEEIYQLELGLNTIEIEVLEEDQETMQIYTLNVTREKIPSDNVNIKVYVNDKEVIFKDYNSETIYLSPNTNELNIDYNLEDDKSYVNLSYDKKIEYGDKQISLIVTAENGRVAEYTINIHKNNNKEEIISTIIGISILGLIGYIIYKFIIFIKKK